MVVITPNEADLMPAAVRLRSSWWWLRPLVGQAALLAVAVLLLRLGTLWWGQFGAIVAGVVAVGLTATSVVMVAEVAASRWKVAPPAGCHQLYPDATAIVAAYLPNEQHIILETLDHLLGLAYRGRLQVICAYNSPVDLPVEAELRRVCRQQPRLTVIRVEGSRSKAENVNAALARATGSVVGIFDADHHPRPGAFERAWHWMASGVDVVQGSCRVRDGSRSLQARIVASEFDAMYRVTHPGRARVHGFAVFGGSNGYWRDHVLRATLLDPSMLTEDIDASIRALAAGARIVVDPEIVSTELAPASTRALWNQRLRWAQGWSQVARRRLVPALASAPIRGRARLGLIWVFVWCELLPWLSLAGLGVLVHDARWGGVQASPSTLAVTLFNLVVGPMHAWAGRRRLDREERHAAGWYLVYALATAAAYTEALNAAKRIGHLRELVGHRRWVVTPRPIVPIGGPATPGSAGRPST